jgi:hypothetical protein
VNRLDEGIPQVGRHGTVASATVAPGLAGSVLTLQTCGFVPTGKVQASNEVAVTFQRSPRAARGVVPGGRSQRMTAVKSMTSP